MESNLIKELCEEGKYSDLELMINGKLYKLHKLLITKSIFFKTLIDNIGKMSTIEEINILNFSGKIIDTKYVDNIIKSLYYDNTNFLEYIIKNTIEDKTISCFKEVVDYYCISDFLQIDEIKNRMVNIINTDFKFKNNETYKIKCVRSNIFSIVDYNKNKNKNKEYNVEKREEEYKYIMEKLYDKIVTIDHRCLEKMNNKFDSYYYESDYSDEDSDEDSDDEDKKIKKHEFICRSIYANYKNYIINKDREKFIAAPKFKFEKILISNIMYNVYNEFLIEKEKYIHYAPSLDATLELVEIEKLFDMVNTESRSILIQLLNTNNWITSEGTILWDEIIKTSHFCTKFGMKEEFANKMRSFFVLFV